MAKSSADDQELRRACEAAIQGTKQSVVMSIRVAKSRGMWGKCHKLGRGNMAKPRVLALSGPPHGIPYGLKDIISVPNYKTTWGSKTYKDQVLDMEAWVY